MTDLTRRDLLCGATAAAVAAVAAALAVPGEAVAATPSMLRQIGAR